MWRITAFLFLVTICIARLGLEAHADPLVPCFFIFGDSLSDAGNNNDLNTKAKANFPPYGIDYLDSVPTGRFTNGRTAVDILAEHLGLQGYIPPFSTAKGSELLKGVNYASGAAGIRPETGQHLGGRISLSKQVEHHKSVVKKLEGLVKGPVREHLNKCLYTFNIGSNDYINNYFMPKHYPTSQQYNIVQYADALIHEYSKQIQALYQSGARKIALFGLGFIGCSLAETIEHRSLAPCVNSINVAAGFFNNKLKSLVDQLPQGLPELNITYINNQAIQIDPTRALKAQLTESRKPCCTLRRDYQCKENTRPCTNRNNYVFFDGFHPTEAVNRLTADRAFKAATPLDAHPYDIGQLIHLK